MLLSRFAENAFWMGRYMERVESLALFLRVTENFSSDEDDEVAWSPVLNVFADEAAFADKGAPITALNVARFYLVDRGNPNSIAHAATMAKENARPLRHLISTESWRQIALFEESVAALRKRRFSESKLSDICLSIREACFSHRGVLEATCYRDEVWLFNRLGAALERADQVTRLIDVKYFRFDRDGDEQAAPPDVAWWNTLLRSASGYHAFQRRHPFNADPSDAAQFLLFDANLPLAVRSSVEAAIGQLEQLQSEFGVRPGIEVRQAADDLLELLQTRPPELSGRALHTYIDGLQLGLIGLGTAVSERYFLPA